MIRPTAFQVHQSPRLPQFQISYFRGFQQESLQLGLLLREFEDWNQSQKASPIRYNLLYFVYKNLWKMISITPSEQKEKALLWLRSKYSQLIHRHLLVPQETHLQSQFQQRLSIQPEKSQCKPIILKKRINNYKLNTKVRARRRVIAQELKNKLSRSEHSLTNKQKLSQIRQDISRHSLNVQNQSTIKKKIIRQFGKGFYSNYLQKVVPVKSIEVPEKTVYQNLFLDDIQQRRVYSQLRLLNFQEDLQPPRPVSDSQTNLGNLDQLSIQQVQKISSKVHGVNSEVLRKALVSPENKQISFYGKSQQLIDAGFLSKLKKH